MDGNLEEEWVAGKYTNDEQSIRGEWWSEERVESSEAVLDTYLQTQQFLLHSRSWKPFIQIDPISSVFHSMQRIQHELARYEYYPRWSELEENPTQSILSIH